MYIYIIYPKSIDCIFCNTAPHSEIWIRMKNRKTIQSHIQKGILLGYFTKRVDLQLVPSPQNRNLVKDYVYLLSSPNHNIKNNFNKNTTYILKNSTANPWNKNNLQRTLTYVKPKIQFTKTKIIALSLSKET